MCTLCVGAADLSVFLIFHHIMFPGGMPQPVSTPERRKKPPAAQNRGRQYFKFYIFSGASTPRRARPFFKTLRVVSASFSRAASTAGASPLMRQAV